MAGAMRELRLFKTEVALLTALCDIGGVWPVMNVTRHLSEAADAAVAAAVDFVFAQARTRGDWLARDPAGSYAVGSGEDEYPTPTEGSVAVTGGRHGWQGELRRGDFAVMLSAPRKEQVLAAARALTPVP